MAVPGTGEAYHEEKLVAMSKWKGFGHTHDEQFRKQAGRELFYLGCLEINYEVSGWGAMRDALWYILNKKGESTAHVDQETQQWYDTHVGKWKQDDRSPDPTKKWYEEMDAKFGTTYFIDRFAAVTLFQANDASSPYFSNLNQVCDQCADLKSFVESKEQQYKIVRESTIAWAEGYYKVHNPEKAQKVRDLITPPGSFSNIDKQYMLMLELHRIYEPEVYLKFATWSPSTTVGKKEALIEFSRFTRREDMQLPMIDGLLELEDIDEMFIQQPGLEETMGGYQTTYMQKKSKGEQVLFPPWRNPDFPENFYPHNFAPKRELVIQGIPNRAPFQLKAPRMYWNDLEEQAKQQALAQAPQQEQGQVPEAQAVLPIAETDNVPVQVDQKYNVPDETLTDADMVQQQAPQPDTTRWDNLLSAINAKTYDPPSDEALKFQRSEGTEVHPAEDEGWLCFRQQPDKKLVMVDSNITGREVDPLCKDCSARICSSQKALWSSVDKHVATERKNPEIQDVKEGELEVITESGLFNTGTWAKRWIRATDTGLHYYLSKQPHHLKKAKGSRLFDSKTVFVEKPLPAMYPDAKLKAKDFHYFGFELKVPNQNFFLRTKSESKHAEWVAFFKNALERFNEHDDAQDPNPAKWKARAKGLLDQLADAKKVAEAATVEYTQAKQQRERMEEAKKRAESDREWAHAQASSAEHRAVSLQSEVHKAEMECQGLRREIEKIRSDTDTLKDQAEQMRNAAADNTAETTKVMETSSQTLRQLEAELEQAQRERDEAQAETMSVFAKWRRCEERSPAQSASRVQKRTGLAYAPRTSKSPYP
eukprot:TRINITY_DN11188_c1_g1_i1.p1 TRINITY_DN11188_c1_g1~~TRINITY_DN11188_c1_g1_i1.p1  ORF type:complete len:833 (+),score=225.80 TRINITY_DN11188_c1_g1_i1:45-2501(+)